MSAVRFDTHATPSTFIEVVRARASLQADDVACTYLGDGEAVKAQLTFTELDGAAQAVAARLQGLAASGECVLLLYPPGMEFLTAFIGCLYSGAIAIPLPVPRLSASMVQLAGIVKDLNVRLVLGTSTSLSRVKRLDEPLFEALSCIATEDTHPELARGWQPPQLGADSVAYLQYTSGSTSDRKGVVISHGNVIANLRGIADRFEHHANSVSVNWLPHFHDLGLVSGILQPLYHGHSNICMSPTAFVQQPIRWLRAISRFRGTYSNSPNYGYDLCVRRVSAEQREALDLSSWEVALNGAEPVRAQTVDEFTRAFQVSGFRPEAMYPAYGLAEATLVVSGNPRGQLPKVMHLDANELEANRVVESDQKVKVRDLVSCGRALPDTEIAIVNPSTSMRCKDGVVGEIWVNGPGVSTGYWNRKAETRDTFGAKVDGNETLRYLRTGDLGYLSDHELFITGRVKDVIIVRGGNYYPQDIEWTVEQCHEGFRQGCGAAFSIDGDDGELLVVAYELERDYLRDLDVDKFARLARKAIAEEHELSLATLLLLKTGTVPRTSSGKIQRQQCRSDFLDGKLNTVGIDESQPDEASPRLSVSSVPNATLPISEDRGTAPFLIEWLRDYSKNYLNSRLMDERRSISPAVILDFGNNGLLGLQVEKTYGGLGLGYRDMLQVIAQLGAIDQTLAMLTVVHNTLGIRPIVEFGSAELKQRYLPTLATGRELGAFAITEPGAGSNPQSISATAVADGLNGWVLRGQKSWSGTAGWASVINVFAQNVDSDGQEHGFNGFVIPRGARGLVVGPEAQTLGMRAMVQNTIYLNDVPVNKESLLGEIGAGMSVAQDAMMHGRLAIGSACVGGIKRCLQLLLRYANRRQISTGRLSDNPVFVNRITSLAGAVSAIEGLVMKIANILDRGANVPGDAFVVCKIAGPEWFWRAADDLVQFLGGRGYIESNIAPQLLRDARVTRILEGPTEALVMFLGSRVLNDGAEYRRFLTDDLGAPSVADRVITLANEIDERCADGPFADKPSARRWAQALIGQIASDAMLLAILSDRDTVGTGRYLGWAEQNFENSVVRALSACGKNCASPSDVDLTEIEDHCTAAIGDIEQQLAGEDHSVDELLVKDFRNELYDSAAIDRIESDHGPNTKDEEFPSAKPIQAITPAALDIEKYVIEWMAQELKIPTDTIDPKESFFSYGIDSVTTVMLAVSLEEWLGCELYPELVYDYPIIRQFSIRVARETS